MSTAQNIIDRAFSKAGIKIAEEPLSASEIADGLDALNDLLVRWDATGTLKGVEPVLDVGTNLMEPRYATDALKSQLAIILAGEYGIDVSPILVRNTDQAISDMVSASINLRDVKFPSTLPVGTGDGGNFGLGYDRVFFPEDDAENF